jgi:hypothetical protein
LFKLLPDVFRNGAQPLCIIAIYLATNALQLGNDALLLCGASLTIGYNARGFCCLPSFESEQTSNQPSPRSARELRPLVEGFGQDVQSSRGRSELSHVLKVFLIDRAGDIREIYTSNFLHPQMVLNDIETLLAEDAGGN